MRLILIVALAASLAPSAKPEASAQNHHAVTGTSAQKPAQSLQIMLPSFVKTDIERLSKTLETANAREGSAAKEQDARQYLKSQKRMAHSAMNMFWVGVAESTLTLFGIVLLALTLAATRRAANAAEGTLRQIGENARTELRAYLSVEPAGIVRLPRKTDHGYGVVRIRNVGKIPASRVSVIVHMALSKNIRYDDFKVSADNDFVSRTIQPEATLLQGSEEDRHYNIISEGGFIYVFGIAYYDDGFLDKAGNPLRRYTQFCHRYPAEASNDWQSVVDMGFFIHESEARYHVYNNEAN